MQTAPSAWQSMQPSPHRRNAMLAKPAVAWVRRDGNSGGIVPSECFEPAVELGRFDRKDFRPLVYGDEAQEAHELILMPRRLTAENGAKAALIGEFRERYCSSSGATVTVDIPWTTIKDIYAAAVRHFHGEGA